VVADIFPPIPQILTPVAHVFKAIPNAADVFLIADVLGTVA
jgi:hypothetical protein